MNGLDMWNSFSLQGFLSSSIENLEFFRNPNVIGYRHNLKVQYVTTSFFCLFFSDIQNTNVKAAGRMKTLGAWLHDGRWGFKNTRWRILFSQNEAGGSLKSHILHIAPLI